MKFKIYTAIFILLSSLNAFAVQNIALDKTRIIYIPNDKNIITVYNKSESPFLIQAKIKQNSISKNNLEAGIVAPPLFRIEPDSKFTTNIIINSDNFPDDRESLLHLYILSIPSLEKKEENNNSISIASESVLKVFYRPLKINENKNELLNKLSFNLKDNNLIIDNKSPYYVTFSDITLDKEKISLNYDNSMISPFSSIKYLTKYTNTKVMSFSIITDDGSEKKIEYQKEIK
ncbi:TPA: molecular chaperone [Proteus mirabilis]|nr:molecular chaperone [Proteus mirabilis]HCT9193242.1 molecular chaperone [Proteus mirabilis]HCT9196617.1 molecular chaperone [Proteus mirabilis]HCT9200627.1 molecular chaperone [Proteus mirabilis]HEI8752125.1 molecular chaperone [Proteus mirabilis]